MTNNNPLIETDLRDTLCNIENHLRFINDYFAIKQQDGHCGDDMRIWHGLCHTLDMSINALRFCQDHQGNE